MSTQFTLAEAQLIALFMESVFYGLLTWTFFQCLFIVFKNAGALHKTTRPVLIVVLILMFIVATLDISLLLRFLLNAFIYHPDATDEELSAISYWIVVFRGVTPQVQTALGDGMLVYRCFVVYGRRWRIIIVPIILMVGTMGALLAVPILEGTFKGEGTITASRVNIWTNVGFSLAVVQNVVTTGLIAYRLWAVSKPFKGIPATSTYEYHASPLLRTMGIIIESGLIYTIATIITVSLSFSKNLAIYPVSDCWIQIIGISFNLIIIRIDSGVKLIHTSHSETHEYPLHSVVAHGPATTEGILSRSIQVNVLKDVEYDAASECYNSSTKK